MLPENLDILYRLGDVIMTPSVRQVVPDDDLADALLRHAHRTWGEDRPGVGTPSRRPALEGCRVLTLNRTPTGIRFCVLSEDDLHRTLVLLPEECRTLPWPNPCKKFFDR
jgi:hypothetical protein